MLPAYYFSSGCLNSETIATLTILPWARK